MRFAWPFYRTSYNGNSTYDIISTVAKILDPKLDPRCADSKFDPDLLCVKIEHDLNQCIGAEVNNSGYLARIVEGFGEKTGK